MFEPRNGCLKASSHHERSADRVSGTGMDRNGEALGGKRQTKERSE